MSPLKAIFLLFCCATAHAKWLRIPYESVRATGMGNAYLAVADDKDALWYNPAGLADVKGIHFDLYDFVLGADSNDSLQRMRKGFLLNDSKEALRADTQFTRFGFFPSYHAPNFGIGLFYQLQGFTEMGNLTNAFVDIYGASDLGAIAGVGFPLGDRVSFGASVRVFQRTGLDFEEPTADFLNSIQTTGQDFLTNVYDHLKPRIGKGWAVGVTAGLLADFPQLRRGGRWQFALTVDDIADTKFRSLDGRVPPPNISASYNAGAAYVFPTMLKRHELRIAADIRNVTSGASVIQLLHAGGEWKFKGVGLRLGMSEGYLTAGVGYETMLFRIQASTYGSELGSRAFERGTRWYLIQIAMGLHLDKKVPKVPGWTPTTD